MVPANRNIDGIPAYAQCAGSSNSAIYSNNGVDTSTTQMGNDWVRTQWSGGYQCTELAHRYLYFKWQVKWIPNGNAGAWCDSQPPANSGIVQTMTPVHGDIMVLAPGSCGADMTTGHVNVIDVVNGDKLIAVEQNGARRGNYQLSCGKCFLHVVANNGAAPSPTAGPAAAGAPASPQPASNKAPAAGSGAALPPPTASAPTSRPTRGAAGASSQTANIPPAVTPTASIPPATAAAPSSTTAPQPLATTGAAGAVAATGSLTANPNGPASTRVGAPAQSACSVTLPGGANGAERGKLALFLGLGLLAFRPLRRRALRRR
jgi:hypothetical protein